MTKLSLLATLVASVFATSTATSRATGLDDIQFWAGTGTNRAALVIHWSAPEVRNNTSVPNPAAEKSLVWGYRWDGTNNAEQMFNAIIAADHRLFVTLTPFPGFGPFIQAIGYDLNNNGVFGLTIGTNVYAESAFTNGQIIFNNNEDSDSARPLDAGDLFWSGSFGPGWEMWQETFGAGGFTNAPDRGSNPYWTPGDTNAPYFGSHGQWDFASGLELITLKDGSWIGFTVSAGGLDFPNPDAPGSIAYNYHKHAPISPGPAPTNSAYAVSIVAAQGPFGASPYNDTNCVLGAPATRFYESVSKPKTRVKMIEAAYNYSVANGVTNKLIITLNTGSSIVARFDHPVYDNPANPYGIDFQVFGNAFYSVTSGGFSSDTANMNNFIIGSGVFSEPTKVSVSPGYTGLPGESDADPSTWPWYRYDSGPYGDSAFPTHAYKWNRTGTNWTEELLDFTKPVNPMMSTRFSAGGLPAPDGIELYNGSGGGTGFDLKTSGFAAIQYIKVEGLSGFSGGEIDAFSVVRPMTLGDTLSILPANLTNNTAQLFFQKPGAENQNVLALNFSSISDIAQVTAARLDDTSALAAVPGTSLNAVQLGIAAILNTNAVAFQADLALSAGAGYSGNGSDLRVFAWSGTNWNMQPFTFTNNSTVLAGATSLSALVVAQVGQPQVSMQTVSNGYTFQFTAVPNWTHALQRSTDLVDWATVTTITPTNTQSIVLSDTNAPPDKAFYRLQLSYP